MSRPPRVSARAAAPASVGTAGGSPIEDLLLRCEPRLRTLLSHYDVAPEDTEDLLFQAFIVLVYRWEGVRDPESWLFTTLRSHCRRYRRDRDRGSAG